VAAPPFPRWLKWLTCAIAAVIAAVVLARLLEPAALPELSRPAADPPAARALEAGECRRNPRNMFPIGARLSAAGFRRRLERYCVGIQLGTEGKVTLRWERFTYDVRYAAAAGDAPDVFRIVSVAAE
jgi:hypothetical protein